jgi:hypothetical protein
VEEDGSIRLVPKLPVDRALAEKYQLADIDWAVKQKGKEEAVQREPLNICDK